jgi:Tol biopolymer transport system component
VDADTNGVASSDAEGTLPRLSDDGRFVAFCSPDGRLVASDFNGAFDVFTRDTADNTTELISQRHPMLIPLTGGGVSAMGQSALSVDGRWLAFTSLGDDLVLNDTNRAHDVFVHDFVAGTNILVSATGLGVPALGGSSTSPTISADGRLVAFVSAATNLTAYHFNPFLRRNQIYVSNLPARTNFLVSVATDGVTPGTGDSEPPVISQDGRYVVFVSRSINLAAVQNGSGAHTFRRDLATGQTVALATESGSTLPPSMSGDGRYIAYSADSQVRVWDGQTAANIYTNTGPVVSFALSPRGAKLACQVGVNIFVTAVKSGSNLFAYVSKTPIESAAQWSADERYFAFVSSANLVGGDNNGTNDVYLLDTEGSTLSLVSLKRDHIGSASGPSDSPVVSWDGRFVVFRSFATNVTSGAASTPPNLFVYDRFTGSNSVLTINGGGSPWTSWMARPMISPDASKVAFLAWASLTDGDINRVSDVFATVVLPVDADGDGMDDSWERHYFGTTARDGNADFDHDGVSDLTEFRTGTNPTQAASVLRLDIAPVVSGGAVILGWPTVPGKTYHVQSKENLNDLDWSDISAVLATSIRGSFTVPADQGSRYYRIVQLN